MPVKGFQPSFAGGVLGPGLYGRVDLAKYDGNVVIKRVPVEHAAKLDEDSTNPWYGIDWKSFHLEWCETSQNLEAAPCVTPYSRSPFGGVPLNCIPSHPLLSVLELVRTFSLYPGCKLHDGD